MSDSKRGGFRAGSGRKAKHGKTCVMRVPERFKDDIKAYIEKLCADEVGDAVVKVSDESDQIELDIAKKPMESVVSEINLDEYTWANYANTRQGRIGDFMRSKRKGSPVHKVSGREGKLIQFEDGSEISAFKSRNKFEICYFESVTKSKKSRTLK